MRRTLLFLCLFITCALANVSAQEHFPSEDAVKKIITDFAAAWNSHDVPAMMALHTFTVNFTNIAGQWWKGQEEVTAGLRHVHSTVFSKSTMTVHTEQVKFLSDKVAVVHGTMELHDVPPAAQGQCASMRVLVYQNGRWLIDDFQNTLIRPPDAP